jgi:hypothetical protein
MTSWKPYFAELEAQHIENVGPHNMPMMLKEIEDWLKENTPTFVSSRDHKGVLVLFKNEEDAAMAKLRWGFK